MYACPLLLTYLSVCINLSSEELSDADLGTFRHLLAFHFHHLYNYLCT
jgi:hypothetical protein